MEGGKMMKDNIFKLWVIKASIKIQKIMIVLILSFERK